MTLENFIKNTLDRAGVENKETLLAQVQNLKGDVPDEFGEVLNRLMTKEAAMANSELATHFFNRRNQTITQAQAAKLEAAGFTKDEIKIITDLSPEERTEKILSIQHDKLVAQGKLSVDEKTKSLQSELDSARKVQVSLESQLQEARKNSAKQLEDFKDMQVIRTELAKLNLRTDILSREEVITLLIDKANTFLASKNAKIKVIGGTRLSVVNKDDGVTPAYDEYSTPLNADKIFRSVAAEAKLLNLQKGPGAAGGNNPPKPLPGSADPFGAGGPPPDPKKPNTAPKNAREYHSRAVGNMSSWYAERRVGN